MRADWLDISWNLNFIHNLSLFSVELYFFNHFNITGKDQCLRRDQVITIYFVYTTSVELVSFMPRQKMEDINEIKYFN
jgi:hypothetical protein